MIYHSFNLGHWDLHNKWILLRIDGNIPVKNNQIIDDSRLECILQTLNFIHERGGKCIIVTHRGRPNQFDAALSTEILVQWFVEEGFIARFARDVSQLQLLQSTDATCIVLENIRFFELLDADEQQDLFKELSQCAHYYVFDAWGVAHRNDPSLIELPLLFLPHNRSIGLCVQHEMQQLAYFKACENIMLLVGGGKGDEKMRIIKHNKKIQTLITLPTVSNSFLKTNSTMHDAYHCKSMKDSLRQSVTLLDPSLPLVINGVTPYEDQMSFDALIEILQARSGRMLVCGGDTVAALRNKLHNATFSTGGGSTLSYLADIRLPALATVIRD